MALSKQTVFIGDFYEKAQILSESWGKTDLYSTGYSVLDTYFQGGFGRKDGYEIVLVYGPTGIGKSTLALNLISQAVVERVRIGLLVLEDDMPDVSNRLKRILGDEEYDRMNKAEFVRCLPEDALTKSWNLDDLLAYIESWLADGVDLILLDHLQFAFENAEAIKGENEYIAQRVFMQKLNQVMKRTKKTIVLISHMNKAANVKGMDRIVGSGALAQVATKVVEVAKSDISSAVDIQIRKSRFTATPDHAFTMKVINGKLAPAA